jgi:hypothetical protein
MPDGMSVTEFRDSPNESSSGNSSPEPTIHVIQNGSLTFAAFVGRIEEMTRRNVRLVCFKSGFTDPLI